jgi:hypothetical protein
MSLRSTNVRLGAIASVALLAAGPTFTEEAAPGARTVFIQGPAALAVTSAVEDAVSRLREPGCQRVLDDFTNQDGRPLSATLGATPPDDYLARLVLREGEIPRGSGRCGADRAAAFTAGGAAVFVCGRSFQRLGRGARACALIHEMLHTLGLRENPPSSAEISRRVAARCGR